MSFDILLVNLDKILVYVFIFVALLYLLKYKKSKVLDYLLALVLAVSSAEIIKSLINKPRPIPKFEGLVFEGSSFPSTHTTIAFVTAVFVCHTLSLKGRKSSETLKIEHVLACIGFLSVAILIGYLRIFVGAHYLIDVIGGAILGSLISVPFRYYDVVTKRLK